jgi:hypothetical protein
LTICHSPKAFEEHINTDKHKGGSMKIDYICPVSMCAASFIGEPLIDVAQHVLDHHQRHGYFGRKLKKKALNSDDEWTGSLEDVTFSHILYSIVV